MSITEQAIPPSSGRKNRRALDEVDLRILSTLRENGRISMAALAERVNVSRAGVYNRVEQMT